MKVLALAAAATLSASMPVLAMESQLVAYIAYIEDVTTLKYDGQPLPEIVSESPEEMLLRYYGDFEVAQAEYKGETLPAVDGLYDAEINTIYVVSTYDLNGMDSAPTLIHELVHYMQDINGEYEEVGNDTACLEGLAYDVQATWQNQYQQFVERVPSYEITLLAFMQCGAASQSFTF